MRTSNKVAVALATTLTALSLLPSAASAAADPAARCERRAGLALAKCVKALAGIERKCYRDTFAECGSDHPKAIKAMDKLATAVAVECPSDTVVQDAGFSALTVQSLTDRLQASCLAETQSLLARTYGGPHAAALFFTTSEVRSCLDRAMSRSRKLLAGAAKVQMRCVDKQRGNGNCDALKTAEKVAKLAAKASAKIAQSCTSTPLETLVAIDADDYVARAVAQAECMTAIAHPEVAPLDIDCGPRGDIAAGIRGQYVQVVLDEAEFGTRCGDGSAYAFWVRFAPAGEPVENVVLQMQGGGVCVFESDCGGVSAGLFKALDNNPPSGGLMSNSASVSPFANWTKVYLPYCTQDLFIGGGATSAWPSITVHRWGAINTRAALDYLRDMIWRELDTDSEGYRPDRIKMLFGGTSAGGFGALYNYHYVLDDLQWTHSSAWPDSALALNNGELLGVAGLGLIMLSEASPNGWAAQPNLPPYCFSFGCAVGPTLYGASAPRLKREPEQQFLVLSNQVDSTQVTSTFFDTSANWINTARQAYCDTMGTNGLRYFLPAVTSSNHVIATKTNLFTDMTADGIVMRDWLDLAMSDPDSAFDAVEEGSLVGSISGVNAFPCTVD